MRTVNRYVAAIFALLVLCVAQALAAVGTIDSFEGDVRIVSAAGERAAQAGLELEEGDTVATGAGAWALLAMTDGASLTVRPDSKLRIDSYRYAASAPAGENVGVISLLQGAFRSITGLIGQTNRPGYRVVTPSATIGIRGTDHEPAYFAPPSGAERREQAPGTYDKVNQGESFIRNPRGEIAVKPGQTAFVHHNARSRPRVLDRAPAFYQRHAELDRRAAARRDAFHKRMNEGRRERASDAQERKDATQKTRREQQTARREEQQKRAEERRQDKALQREMRKERQHDNPQKRHRE